MQVILAGLALALAAQVAQDGRYTSVPASPASEAQPTPAAAAPATSEQPEAASQIAIPSRDAAGTEPTATPSFSSADNGGAPSSPPLTTAQPFTFQPPAQNAPTIAAAPSDGLAESSVLANQSPKPSQVMRSLMEAPATGQLIGVEITLGEAVREARSRQDQTARAKAYWDLSAAVGAYHVALNQQSELGILRGGLTAPGEQWTEHQQQAETRAEAARRAAIAAQLTLQTLLGRAASAPLPLPGDIPHCGRYNAEYEEIFTARPDPVARELSQLMPLRYQELRAQAQAIAAAEAWRAQARQQWTSADDDQQLLNAQDLVSLKRRAFIATARDYNQEIAAYTELAAPAQVAPDRLVAMMIRTSATSGAQFRSRSAVEQASANAHDAIGRTVQPAGGATIDVQVQNNGATSRAFAEPSRTEARRPIGRVFNNRERSILSRIRRLPQRLRDRD